MSANPNWINPLWMYRLDITVDHTKVDSNLTDFPLLINITEPHLFNALANGDDILLCKANNDDQLKHEIESFNQLTGELVLWVKTDLSSTVDTLIYLYYGNPASSNQQDINNTWKSNYKMVLHLNEESGTRYDSTINANNASSPGIDKIDGKIDGAIVMTGEDGLNCGHQASLDITNNLKVSCWLKCSWIPVSTLQELQDMQNDLSGKYYLLNDIDCSPTQTWNEDPANPGTYFGFEPIGNMNGAFTGFFDGNNHKLTGLYINRPSEKYVGLFGWAENSGSRICNLDMDNITAIGADYVGGLIGRMVKTYCENIKLTNINVSGRLCVGGLVGIAGRTHVTKSFTTGTIIGDTSVGGIIGGYSGGYMSSFTIYDSYSHCSVTGLNAIGGLVGQFKGHTRSSSKIYRSYSTGLVIFTVSGGGLTGSCYAAVCYDGFWDIQTSNQPLSCAGTGKTTAEMMQQATFTNYDFTNVWGIDEGVSYPSLRIIPPSAHNYVIVSKGRDAYSLEIDQIESKLYAYINNTEISYTIPGNGWNFIEMKYDGINLKLFRNNIEVSSTPLAGLISTNSVNLTIGTNTFSMIDEVRLSDTVETDEWIKAIYDNQNLLAGFLTYQKTNALYFDLETIDHNALAIEGSSVIVRDKVDVIVTEEDTLATGGIATQAYIQEKTIHKIKAYKYGKKMLPSILDIDKDLDWTFTLYNDNCITESDKNIVANYTGIIIDHIAETLTITENHTFEEIYDYCQYNIIANSQPDINQVIYGVGGIDFTGEYDFIVNSGITVSALGKRLEMVAGKTYNLNTTGNFTGILADSTKTRIPVILKSVKDGSQYRIEKTSDGTLLFEGTQSGTGDISNYYEHTVDFDITIKTTHPEYYSTEVTETITDSIFIIVIAQELVKQIVKVTCPLTVDTASKKPNLNLSITKKIAIVCIKKTECN